MKKIKTLQLLVITTAVLSSSVYAGGTRTAMACSYDYPHASGTVFKCRGTNSVAAIVNGGEKDSKPGSSQCDTVTQQVNGVTVIVQCGAVAVAAPE